MIPTEDSMLDDTISQLTSKLPAPPPRPSSIASSSRSSRRSSNASSMVRQSKAFEAEPGAAPPTPSLAGFFAQPHQHSATHPNISSPQVSTRPALSLRDELVTAAASSSVGSPTGPMLSPALPISSTSMDRQFSSGSNSRARMSRNSSTSSVQGTAVVRRKSKSALSTEGPVITIAMQTMSPVPSAHGSMPASAHLERSSSQTSSRSAHPPQRPPPRRRAPTITERSSVELRQPQGLAASALLGKTVGFLHDLLRAATMLWMQVVWPLVLGVFDIVLEPLVKEDATRADDTTSETPPTVQSSKSTVEENSSTFAEQFKSLICTSSLLNTTISIASYDGSAYSPELSLKASPPSEVQLTGDICSTVGLREISSMVSHEDIKVANTASRSSIQMTTPARTLLNGCLLAATLLYPFSTSRETWMRAVLVLTSLVWGVVAVFGVETGIVACFEVTHIPAGSYRPSNFDKALRAKNDDKRVSGQLDRRQRERIHKAACVKVARLIQDCKTFDVECNRALNAIQETELISRGYKLSHPLPPISRIELNSNSARHPILPSASRVVPHSAPPTAVGSGWGHRPVSLTATAAVAMSHNPRMSWSTMQQSNEPDDTRLLQLRKALSSTFDSAHQTLSSAMDRLRPLVDEKELELLREMYDLNKSRPSSHTDGESIDSSLQRRSWASRSNAPASDSTRLSSSPTIDEGHSSPATPINRNSLSIDATVAEKFGMRKRDSGAWEGQTGPSAMRTASRLSYISDKNPLSGTANGPSNNGAMKRLSYGSSGSVSVLASLSYRTSIQGTQRSASQSRRLSNLPSQPTQDLSRPTSPSDSVPAASPVVDRSKIMALKSAFEGMYHLRRRVLCSLLALDFTLRRSVDIPSCAAKSTVRYWQTVGQEMTRLSNVLQSLSESIKCDVHRDLSTKSFSTSKPLSGNAAQQSIGADTSLADDKVDYSGFEDRMMAMGEALRSVQIKMRLCATDLSMNTPSPLHGELDATEGDEQHRRKFLEQNRFRVQQGRADAELMFSTIREDLLTLSAEWESALKIMRVHGLVQANTSDATSKSTDVSVGSVDIMNAAGVAGLDSPQEADEDEMREWVRSRTGGGTAGDLSTSSDIDLEIKALLEHKLASPGEDKDEKDNGKGEDDLATLLLRCTSPQHLPPPGVEQVYEDTSAPKTRVSTKPQLSREERIRAMKEQREAKEAEAAKPTSAGPSLEATSGMIQELQSVMKTRKATNGQREAPAAERAALTPLANSLRHNKSMSFDPAPVSARVAPMRQRSYENHMSSPTTANETVGMTHASSLQRKPARMSSGRRPQLQGRPSSSRLVSPGEINVHSYGGGEGAGPLREYAQSTPQRVAVQSFASTNNAI